VRGTIVRFTALWHAYIEEHSLLFSP